ncbi:MAG: apolipoprotein N-acyltransferase [Salinisphaeraceae bacterium]|jgi:apolipoprotein N-acyltransferase|nr:apolipoprotein N-acyltransferase [Salinisphaeraceae bacterium]
MAKALLHLGRSRPGSLAPWLSTTAAGAVLPLAFAPWSWWWLAPFCVAVLFHNAWTASPGRAFALGYLFGLGLFGVGVSWIHVSMTQYGGGGPVTSFIATGGLIALLALFPALALCLARGLRPQADAWALWASLPAAWLALEWLRTWLFTGFPWLLLGYSQTDAPLAAALAPVTGVLGLSAVVTLLAAALVWCAAGRGWRRWAVTAIAVAALGAATHAGLTRDWTRPAGPPLEVALVQGNFDQAEKWRPENRSKTLARYATLSEPLEQADLIVWPETAMPLLYANLPTAYLDKLTRRLDAAEATLILGAPTRGESGRIFNSAVAVGTSAAYAKRHLVPFGEYVPLRGLFGDLLDVLGAPESDFAPGAQATLLPVAEYRAAIAICYEIIFPSEVASLAAGSNFIVNMSNDAWFGDSIGPWQHLQIARMRAMETQRYVLRATNTGVTAVINDRGRVRAQAQQFEAVKLVSNLVPRTGLTPYLRWRDAPLLITITVLLLFLTIRRGAGRPLRFTKKAVKR